MQVEKQCCTLEQAKRLKELGVEQISYFIWGEKRKALMESWTVDGIEDTFYSAYTVAELGVMISKGTKAEKNYWLWLNGCVHSVCSPTIAYSAVALAGFVINQIEEGDLTVEEINKRLQNS